ncbi:hypothetical protein HDU98_000911 [Podochytrium sp. JEL0797]|nr:hypothetical protein HDU98_000911 [Podochytrium sp. JEL0797]
MTSDSSPTPASTVSRKGSPEMSGFTLVVLDFVLKNFPFVAAYLTSNSGLLSLRQLPPHLLALDIATLALPARGYKPKNQGDGPSLSLDFFESLAVVATTDKQLVSSVHIQHAFAEGRTTPLEVARSILVKLASDNQIGKQGYFNAVNSEDVIAQAEASTERHRLKKPLSFLDGIPVAIKNVVDVKGYVTRVGSSFINGETPASEDGIVVKQLRDLGCVIIGVTNLPEVGFSPVDANTANPWNKSRTCGGSSSGSGGAVSAGYCPIAHGGDAGGSIRLPAAYCGIYGLKTTAKRVNGKGAFPGAPTVAAAGPIAATANDLCIGYLAMADASASGYPAVHVPLNFATFSVSGLRVGVMRDYNAQVSNPAISKALERVEAELVRNGAKIVPIEFPHLDKVRLAHGITVGWEMSSAIQSDPSGNSHLMAHSTSINVNALKSLEVRDYIHAQKLRTHAINTLCALFSREGVANIDVILTPTSAVTAPTLPSDNTYGWHNVNPDITRFAFLPNLAGIPAVSCPVGLDEEGLPIGIQFMGEWWSEGLLLGVAKWMEGTFEGVGRPEGWNGIEV